jgi:DNA-binding NtrC family response regulator
VNRPEYGILVIDDQIGREADHRDEFLKRCEQGSDKFVFCTAQDGDGRNRVDLAIEQTRALWESIDNRRLSLILLDVRFSDPADEGRGARFGFALLRALRERFGRALPIVMLTSVNEARGEANAAEADGFLPKEELTSAALTAQLFRNGIYPETTSGILGTSPNFLLTLRDIRRVVASGTREVLLLGETGTGKSEMAEYVHRASNRAGRFEKWLGRRANAELHYDQLFGHWKGAHDGAKEHRAGLAERAHEGTLFIDEIAELGPETQADLLEYRQRGHDGLRRIRRLGNAPDAARRGETHGLDLFGAYLPHEDRVVVDTTLVSATNRPIDDDTWRDQAGYRKDLFNRLGCRVRLPPLRERVEDVGPLFVELATAAGRRPITLTPNAQRALESHQWREGNVAELKRVAETAITKLGPDFHEVHAHHLEDLLSATREGNDPRATEPPGASSVSRLPTTARSQSFIDVEVRCLRSLAELLRTAVVETRRPTGLGSLADILKQATGVEYAPTDVKREVKSILEGWFAPNARQAARWNTSPEYARQAQDVRNDRLLTCLYRYSIGEITWDVAKTEIAKVLDQ